MFQFVALCLRDDGEGGEGGARAAAGYTGFVNAGIAALADACVEKLEGLPDPRTRPGGQGDEARWEAAAVAASAAVEAAMRARAAAAGQR